MKRWIAIAAVALLAVGCATVDGMMGWTTLIDGEKGLENFNRLGDANWRAEGGAIVADKAKESSSLLVTKNSYKDLQIHAEFWADTTTNSGIFIRITNPQKVGADSSYEVNIYDLRPGQEYGTGGIVNFAKVPLPNPHKAAGKWNTYDITAKGSTITVVFNGVKTVDVKDGKLKSGVIGLQHAKGVKDDLKPIKFRKVEIRAL